MTALQWILIGFSGLEIILLATVAVLFVRVRRSEAGLIQMRQKQEALLENLKRNAELEQELVDSFAQRQEELTRLDSKLQDKVKELRRLLDQAEHMANSPQLVKTIILSGQARGDSVTALAHKTGLSEEEVEWVIEQGRQVEG